jgi:CRISPR/Cas system CSM-associated protein Csm3 (group 7 of RAMP superfamily)
MDYTIAITFKSEWFVGSGFGDGHLADSILVRDSNGLPFLPGRAIKGALREGARRLIFARPDLAEVETFIFGSHCQPSEKGQAAKSFNQPGRIRVGNGRLPREIERLLLAEPPETRKMYVSDLTVRRAQTALTESGVAKTGSLRVIERGLPGLVFISEITAPLEPDLEEAWLTQYLTAVCAMIKGLGGHRSRGLGYCQVVLNQTSLSGKVSLPPVINLKGSL